MARIRPFRFPAAVAPATVAAMVVGAAPLAAQLPTPRFTLDWVQRTGTVVPGDEIPVWLRLTADPTSEDFVFDGSNPQNNFGLGTLLPTLAETGRPFEYFTGAVTNTAYLCSGTFTAVCDPGAYRFDFSFSDPSFIFLPAFSLAAGASYDFRFGTFVPAGGAALPGTYRFFGAIATVVLFGVDDEGTQTQATIDLARTCETNEDDCAFTRTVEATSTVPEPSTTALLAGGLVTLLGAGWRRRRVA